MREMLTADGRRMGYKHGGDEIYLQVRHVNHPGCKEAQPQD